ncbi:MAG: protein kinase [Myxococcales bacterium]
MPEGVPIGSFEGQVLGSYRILRPIAAGGMATVYLARKAGPRGFAQNAAIKVVHPHLALQPEFVEMFLDEARIISLINHPNVCRVLDFGAFGGTYFLAMEYVRGETWGDVLAALHAHPQGAKAVPSISAWVMAQTCEGLHAAHEAHDESGAQLHIVHRDVSPQNLLVGYDGSLRIVDFGVAYAAERSHATRDGAVKGRYGYMAPEQMRGNAVDRRADIWSVGVILREALTGGRLFARENDAATIYAVTEQPLPVWPEHVPLALRAVADRALIREAEGRYATARDMGRDLVRARDADGSASVDLSEWMAKLFAENIERKNALIRELAQLPNTLSPGDGVRPPAPKAQVPPPPPPSMNSTGGHRAVGTTPRSGTPTTSTVREVSKGKQPVPPPVEVLAAEKRPPWVIPVFVAGGVGSLVLLFLLFSGSPEGTPSVTLQTQPTLPAPVVQPMVPSVLSPPSPAGATVQQVAPAVPAEGASGRATEPADKPIPTGERGAGRSGRETNGSEASSSSSRRSSSRAENGTVVIGAVGGWADVFLGARRLGTTPVVATLPAGTHTLTVYPFGKGPAQRSRIEIKAGEQLKHKLTLGR